MTVKESQELYKLYQLKEYFEDWLENYNLSESKKKEVNKIYKEILNKIDKLEAIAFN